MKLLSRLTFIALVFSVLLPQISSAQFKTKTPIYMGAISSDKSKIALADSENISILKTQNLEIITTIPCNHLTRGLVAEIFFAENNDSILCFRACKFNGELECNLDLTYLSDSLYFYNFLNNTTKTYPGYARVAFGKSPDTFCAIVNSAHPFTFNNQELWWTDSAIMFTNDQENVVLNTPVFNCAISSDGEKLAILTRSNDSEKPNELQVLNIKSLEVLFKTVLPEPYYFNIQFSQENNAVYLESCRLFRSGIYSNYINVLGNVKDTIIAINQEYRPQNETILSKQEFGVRLLPTGNEFKIFDLKTEKDIHIFHANTCNLFNIRNAFLINENEIIVFGSFSDYSGPLLTGAANKMKLTDVSAFTKVDEKTGNYRLFNPNEIRILPNTSAINNKSEKKIVVGENRKFVYDIQGRYVEMWGIEDPSILRKFSFENDIDVLADKLDSTLLVLEKHKDLNETNIRIHLVNLNSGVVNFQILSQEKAEEFVRENAFSQITDIDRAALLSSVQKTWPWDNDIEYPLFETSISTDNEEFVLLDKQLLNLKTLDRIQVQNFSNHTLLNREYVGMAAELYTQNYWSLEDESSKTKNTFFLIKEMRPDGKTLAVSPRFKLRFDGPYYKSEISCSSTSRFICAYVNEFFKDTQRDIYLFDIQKNKVQEFLNMGLSWIEFNESDSLFQIVTTEITDQGERKYLYELYDANTFKKIKSSNKSFIVKQFDNTEISKLNAPEYSLDAKYIYSESTKKYFGFFPSGKMFVWNVGEYSPFETVSLGAGKAVHCSFVGENIFVVLNSREAFFIDPITNKVVCTILFLPNEETTDVLWFLPDGSFYAPKNTIPKFHMVKGKNAFPLLNYEALLNRPDRVLAAIGLADVETVEAFEMAYEKRNKKFNIQSLDFNTNIPKLRWKSKMPSTQNDSLVSFSIEIDYSLQEPLTAHVLINGVPVYGMNGLPIEGNKREFTCTATLENGSNEILVYAQTQNGINSFPLSKEVISNYNFQRRVFFAGIGVSEYIDTTKNLTFAHSDVLKLSEAFLSAYDNDCRRLVLTNEKATRENILNLKQFLEKTNVNDIVVLAFAGHGTIGTDKSFYFCSHDINFKNPENTGVSYAEIESLLDNIPARKKLLLLDACHSGEIDSSFTPVFVSDSMVKKDKRGIDVVVTDEPTSQKQINFLVESLFSNLNNGTGAYVISASAGTEYAYETAQTGGVFTYSFLESFKSHFYSYNSDASISILQQETYQKVTELTKGAQRPTTRAENTRSSWKFEQ